MPTLAPAAVELRWLAGVGAFVVAALLLLLYVYRRRLYIFQWSLSWLFLSAAVLLAARGSSSETVQRVVIGLVQFLNIASALLFVVSVDSYRHRPRVRRGYLMVLLPLLIWFALAPLALDPRAVLVPGFLIAAGVLGAAGIGYLTVLRHTRMLGPGLIGVTFALLAAASVWVSALMLTGAPLGGSFGAQILFGISLLYTVAALGMHLMAFEDMTFELRQTNRRLEEAQAELRQLVITDPLTGCYNRRFFDEVIHRELHRHERYKVPLTLMFVDVDRFKIVNDSLGHEAGDRVLRSVARFLMRSVREADYVFRWGGDEFLILISCGEQKALRKALELQAAFDAAPESSVVRTEISLSIGCAEVPPGTDDVMPLLQSADERMYAEKARSKVAVRH